MKAVKTLVVMSIVFGLGWGCVSSGDPQIFSGRYQNQIMPIAGIESNDPNFPINTAGDVIFNKAIYVPEYHGLSDIHLDEDAVTFGLARDARIFVGLDPISLSRPAWVFQLDCPNEICPDILAFNSPNIQIIANSGNICIFGTLCFVDPNSGMIEGEISGYNGGISLTSVAQGDWDQIMAFTVNGPSNLVDPNHLEDHLMITEPGRYACRWRWSGHGTAVAHDWEFLASKNNNAVMLTNTASKFTNPTTQKDVTVPGGGTILCEIGDTIELWVRRNTPGNMITLTTETCWLYVRQTGGS